jgi:hypothetical protein
MATPWDLRNKSTVKAPTNPLDKATIVSIYPKVIDERKWTLDPGHWVIQPGTKEKPSVLVVGPSSWWREIDEDQPLLEIPVSSILIAESIVRDYCNGILGANIGASQPGLFFIPGEHTAENILKNYPHEIVKAVNKQKHWYEVLLKMADALWARSQGNPMVISDDMRLAAKELGHMTRDWMRNFQMMEMTRCAGCGALKNPAYPICGTCRLIDKDHPGAKDLKFAV